MDKLVYEATANKLGWTLLADFRKLRIRYENMQFLTPLGTELEFSYDQDKVAIIARDVDYSTTFDKRPVVGQLWCRVTKGEDTASVVLHIW
jgi:hypothetical protein